MFAQFRRHRWLWSVIFGATILSFVWWLNPASRYNNGGGGSVADSVGTVNGHAVSRADYLKAQMEARLQFCFNNQLKWPEESMKDVGAFLADETRNRLVLLDKLKEYNIQVDEKAGAQWVYDIFRDPAQGRMSQSTYDNFVNTVLPKGGVTLNQFAQFAAHQAGVQQLISLVGISGKLLAPSEAERLYRAENEEVDTEIALLETSNYLSKVTTDPLQTLPAVQAYYTNHQSTYRVPEKAEVRYVKFAFTNYFDEADKALAGITNLSAVIDQNYEKRGTNDFLDDAKKPLSPEAAKQKLRDDYRMQAAGYEAQKRAIAFANDLFALDTQTNMLRAFATSKGLTSEVTAPFGRGEIPAGMDVPSGFASAIFTLTETNALLPQPVGGKEAIYVTALERKFPSYLPPLEETRTRVTEDYTRSRANDLCWEAGRALYIAITNGMAQGKSFKEIAATNATYLDLPSFSRETESLPELGSAVNLGSLQDVAFRVKPGQTAAFEETATGGFILRVQRKVPVSDAKVKAELPAYMERLKQKNYSDAINGWFTKQVQAAQASLPGVKERN